jgi:hypothetical protein
VHDLDRAVRVAVLSTLRTATAIDDGATPEQERLIDAVGTHLLGLADLAVEPLDASGAGAAITDPALRRIVGEGLVTLELMRHPGSDALTERIDGYLVALGFEGPEQLLVRDAVAGAADQVLTDWSRTRTASVSVTDAGVDELAVLDQVAATADCPPGSLGRAFHDFNVRHGFSYSVGGLSLVGHDFAHVITGYEAVPEGELALQAFLVAAGGGAEHASGLLASLLLYEVGLLRFPEIEPKTAVLDRPGATDLLVDAVRRGSDVTQDVQALDHLALVDRDLIGLRVELGVDAPELGPFTFAG